MSSITLSARGSGDQCGSRRTGASIDKQLGLTTMLKGGIEESIREPGVLTLDSTCLSPFPFYM
ncbi:hypothetical protein DPMN_167745 [Dreissena polymorpha]|uniref:Uncharacterized protein n=1 Tax=Dreissena polymorpha TaxID=45954 RepID=A0A9D4F0T6_DREPO|nr:hypothetical protein DPMN_167745 [Dreissena polymorpha]